MGFEVSDDLMVDTFLEFDQCSSESFDRQYVQIITLRLIPDITNLSNGKI